MRRCWVLCSVLATACGGGGGPDTAATAEEEKQRNLFLISDGPHPGGEWKPTTISVYGAGMGETLLSQEGGSPNWTPDGHILFSSTRSGSQQIWIMDADGSHARQIGELPSTLLPVMPQMAKNGLIAFMGADANSVVQPDTNVGIWTVQSDGSNLKEITTGMQPFLALSGDWIAYTFQTEDPYHRQIWRINTDGTNQRQLTFLGDPDYPDANAPNISPDESKIAIFSGKESDKLGGPMQSVFTFGHRNVAVIPATGGVRRTLTPCKPVTTQEELDATTECIAADNPAWTPDSQWLIFDVGFKDAGQTWLVDKEGHNFQRFYDRSRGTVRVALKWQ